MISVPRFQESYTDDELDLFITEWNAACKARAKNPYASTNSRSIFLKPELALVDDEFTTARQKALKMLTYSGRKERRTTGQALQQVVQV